MPRATRKAQQQAVTEEEGAELLALIDELERSGRGAAKLCTTLTMLREPYRTAVHRRLGSLPVQWRRRYTASWPRPHRRCSS